MSVLERNQRIIAEYRASGEPWPATTRDIGRWAIARGLWQVSPGTVLRQCADQLRQALREEFFTDPQGRTVRAKHAARYEGLEEKLNLRWDDIRTASHDHMEMAFALRRQQIVGDCRQLKQDIDSYNENYNTTPRMIQMCFDFAIDLEELEIESAVAV